MSEAETGPSGPPAVLPIEECIDLHGFRPADVVHVVDDYLEAAQAAGYAEVRLIHGRGKGVQRAQIRARLASHPRVRSFADAPAHRGGWGATVVLLAAPAEASSSEASGTAGAGPAGEAPPPTQRPAAPDGAAPERAALDEAGPAEAGPVEAGPVEASPVEASPVEAPTGQTASHSPPRAASEGGSVLLSVVVPMYNEASNVEALVGATTRVLKPLGVAYELLLVSDGATDGTWPAIVAAAQQDPALRGVALARNFGHQNALWAGYHYARGQAVVSMDGDLQHPPEVIPELLDKWKKGYKVVRTIRLDSPQTSRFKALSSRYFYRVFSRLSGVPVAPGSSDFRLLDQAVLRELTRVNDVDLFLRGLVTWLGHESATVTYQAADRHSGDSKYSLRRMLRFSLAAITSFSALPLRLGIGLGFITSVLSFAELCYILVQYARGHTVPGWASMMALLALMFGVLFILLGIIGTYLGKVYEIVKARPRFVVRESVGFEPGFRPEP